MKFASSLQEFERSKPFNGSDPAKPPGSDPAKPPGSAEKVEEYVVFNVGGNKYRLIAIVSHPKGKVYIQDVLTHKEYDRGAWKDD